MPRLGSCALLPDVQAEHQWIADHLRMRYQRAGADGVKPPTAAVLVRLRRHRAIADTLRARGIPAEVVRTGRPTVHPRFAEVVAMLPGCRPNGRAAACEFDWPTVAARRPGRRRAVAAR